MSKVIVTSYRSVRFQEFEFGGFTVLFGKNNAGKTNLLEAIYGVLAPQDMPSVGARAVARPVRGIRGAEDLLPPSGAVHVELEPGFAFDDGVLAVLQQRASVQDRDARFRDLPPGQVWFANAFDRLGLWCVDVTTYFNALRADWLGEVSGYEVDEIDDQFASLLIQGPRPRPLFLGWEFDDVDDWVTAAIAELTAVPDELVNVPKWLESVDGDGPSTTWRVRPEIRERLDQLAMLATDLLPDFLDGSIRAEFRVPTEWGAPSAWLWYDERGDSEPCFLDEYGRGASRWMAIAVQVALRLMEGDSQVVALDVAGAKTFSGQVLIVDEPEAHLHPSAVASVVRWCQRMVRCGFHVVAASHHEEFLRATGQDVTFVKVSRDPETGHTKARALLSSATPLLQELAAEVGMHPAAVLSLHRGILFVEGPLDEAVLDEYAGPELDAAGVTIIPIHGTRNLQGLVDGEFTTRLGIKVGILTDATVTATMWDRSNTKRSSEEVKIVRLIKRFEDAGLPPPHVFGVAEDDLLFALPVDAIRDWVNGPFPDWADLIKECRAASGLGPSDSVDWKSHAQEHYGLPLTTSAGVRTIVRALDLAGVELPSIRTAVDEVLAWAT